MIYCNYSVSKIAVKTKYNLGAKKDSGFHRRKKMKSCFIRRGKNLYEEYS